MNVRVATRALTLILIGLVVGCGSKNSMPPGDAASDLRPDQGRGPEARADQRRADLAPDRPRTPPRWELVPGPGPLNHYATATLLPNGDVLLAGGVHRKGYVEQTVDEVHLYQAASNSVVPVAKLATPRCYHRATLLPDGRVLVTGGENENSYSLSSTELFDPAKQTWTAGPPLPTGRSMHTATLLPSGELVVTGGYNDYQSDSLSTVATLDAKLTGWKALTPTLKVRRRLHTATHLASGKLLLVGGLEASTATATYHNTLEVYDPANGQSTLLAAKLSRPRGGHTAHLLPGNQVLFIGGVCLNCPGVPQGTDDLYDPAKDTITLLMRARLLGPVFCAVTLLDQRVLIFGDQQGAGEALAFVPAVMMYETNLPVMKLPRYAAGCVRLTDGSVLAAGGLLDPQVTPPGDEYAASAERFFP